MTKDTLWHNPVIGYDAPKVTWPGAENVGIGIEDPRAHSPLPFGEPMLANLSGVYSIRDANGKTTVCAYNATDAAFVRRACNNHQALLAACKELVIAVAAAMRVVADMDEAELLGLSAGSRKERLIDELHASGVVDGFGVRAQAAIANATGDLPL